jgi:hypothetical protein
LNPIDKTCGPYFVIQHLKKEGEGKKRQTEWWDTDSVDSVKPLGKYERNE